MVKKNLIKKAGAICLALGMMASITTPAFAAFSYRPVGGSQTTFNKYLIMSAGDNVPGVTFNYTIASGEAVSIPTDDNQVFQVNPGPTPNAVTITPTVFSSSDTTNAAVQSGHIDVSRAASTRASGLNANTGVEFEVSKGEKYAVKEATVSFANVQFDEPGIYRYIITETASPTDEAKGIMHDNDVDRVLDVYVTDNGSGTLSVAGYVMHTDINSTATPAVGSEMGTADVQTAGAALADKTDGFTNEYNSKDLAFKAQVSGNQASRDKYFDHTLTLTGLTPGDKYTVSLADDNNPNTTDGNADPTSGDNSATLPENRGKTNVVELTADGQGNITQHFYLQHDQSIAVRGLPANANYSVTANKEDYKSEPRTVTGYENETSGVIKTVAGSNKVAKTSYKFIRNGIIPTGAAFAVGTAAIALGFGGVGVAATMFRKKENDEEEDI